MFCSSCGKPLGAVAHIYNDKLLCEDCFLKVEDKSQADSPSSTVFVAKHDDQERAQASQQIPTESNPIPSPQSPPVQEEGEAAAQSAIPQTHVSFFFPGEQVIWKRTFSKGIIHREATFTEVITNMRAFVIDDIIRSIVRACPLRGSVIVVTNTRRDSTQTRMGYGYSGHYGGAGIGTSHTVGDVQFLRNGNLILSLHHIVDPYGLKKLIDGSVKSSTLAASKMA
jgi:hypothetical protein